VALKVFVKHWLEKNLVPTQEIDFETWILHESCHFNGERIKQLRLAFALLQTEGLTLKEASYVKSFVKCEVYDRFKPPRMIFPRSDKVKVYCGPFFHTIEELLYKLEGPVRFIKLIPVPDRPRLISSLNAVGAFTFSSDFSAFESHFTSDIMDAIECQLYQYVSLDREKSKFICSFLTGVNRIRMSNGCKVDVKARRMSGDCCTSLGNGFTNMILALYIAHTKDTFVRGFVEGDDGLFVAGRPFSPADYESCGFTIKISVEQDACHASFCGIICGEDGQIIRDPRKFLSSFGWTHSMPGCGNHKLDQLLRAKALSTVYETPNCPIVSVLARQALQFTRHVTPLFLKDTYRDVTKIPTDESKLQSFQPTLATRFLFAQIYGVSVDTQFLVEQMILNNEVLDISKYIHPHDDQSTYSDRYVVVV